MYLLEAPAEGEYGKFISQFVFFFRRRRNLFTHSIFFEFFFACAEDVFAIQELTIFKGKHNNEVYACAGDVLDGYFYDLLMNLLAEKGINDEFAIKLSELATQHEQSLFVNLLQETKKFFE